MYAVVARQAGARPSQHGFTDSGRASQARVAAVGPSECPVASFAPAVRRQRGAQAAMIERAARSAPSPTQRVASGRHLSPARTGAAA